MIAKAVVCIAIIAVFAFMAWLETPKGYFRGRRNALDEWIDLPAIPRCYFGTIGCTAWGTHADHTAACDLRRKHELNGRKYP